MNRACPPCSGNCRQARSCPAFLAQASSPPPQGEDAESDRPIPTPEQVMAWVPNWLLVSAIAVVLFLVLVFSGPRLG